MSEPVMWPGADLAYDASTATLHRILRGLRESPLPVGDFDRTAEDVDEVLDEHTLPVGDEAKELLLTKGRGGHIEPPRVTSVPGHAVRTTRASRSTEERP